MRRRFSREKGSWYGMTKKDTLGFLSKFAFCVEHAAMKSGKSREVDSLRDVIERQEKEHRALGRRLVGGTATKGRFSVRLAVDYFVTRGIADATLREKPSERPIREFIGVREDYARAAIIVADKGFRDALVVSLDKEFPEGAHVVCEKAFSLDYAELVK
jgi:hypothetical protein